ncbi:lectin like domain-containing protein [Lachnoclostridium pacaense]|nr:lectin like domain-containing protein [Lachnoclostridium pacaense]MCC2817096.1 lectin like domain-containing protein [Lachnoclostridium pacaense]
MLILLGLILAGNSAGCSRLLEGGQGMEKAVDDTGADDGTGIQDGFGSEGGTGTQDGFGSEGGTGTQDGFGLEGGTGTQDGFGLEGGTGTQSGSGTGYGRGTMGSTGTGSGSEGKDGSGPADTGHGSAGKPGGSGQGTSGTDGQTGAHGQSGADHTDGNQGKAFPYTWNRGRGADIKLPESYDYRKAGRAPQIGNQGSLGTCWAFASLTALESSLLPTDREMFAVDHMTMHNSFLLGQDEGGEYTMSMAYLLAWQGPVLESEDPYGDGYSPDNLKPSKHVQEIQVLGPKDYDAVKRAVYLQGGVQSSLFTSMRDYESESVYYNRETNSYCYIGSEQPNHDSVIVGWDDNYPKENFNMELEGDGAFICTNSWGEDFGDQGYFYVSYHDSNIGVHNIVYTGVEPVDNYKKIYQSDLCGWVGQIGYGQDEAWFANTYRAGKGEDLAAAGFYATDKDTEYEIYVARNLPEAGSHRMEKALNSRTPVVRGKLANAGYYTVSLKEKIRLDDNEKFAIIIKITTPGTVHPVAIEYDAGDGIAQVDLSDGEGYLSHNGSVWEHVEETQKCNLCLKAYTE